MHSLIAPGNISTTILQKQQIDFVLQFQQQQTGRTIALFVSPEHRIVACARNTQHHPFRSSVLFSAETQTLS
jgi:hypothetical protein